MQAEQIPAKKYSQSSKSSNVDIDPDLLFQRILSVCSDKEQLSEAFTQFSGDGFLKTGDKSAFCRSIIKDYPFFDVMSNIP